MGERRGAYRVLMRKPDGKRDRDVDERIILIWIFKKRDGGMNIDLAQERDRWWALVNVVMNCLVP
jgi:hypothetical protein